MKVKNNNISKFNIIGIVGKQGAGKTIMGMALINMLLYSLKLEKDNCDIYSNINLNFKRDLEPNSFKLLKEGDLSKIVNGEDRNKKKKIFFIDEAHIVLDSRQWAKGENVDLTQLLMYLRKSNILLLYTTQTANQIDSRLRMNSDLFLIMDRNFKGKSVRGRVYDIDILSGKMFNTGKKVNIKNPEYLYGTYDTFETAKKGI